MIAWFLSMFRRRHCACGPDEKIAVLQGRWVCLNCGKDTYVPELAGRGTFADHLES